ncbi:MAG: alginate export family protein [Nitrospirae bacterium]|nr:alginate export family protein [Nitrospirota bacterium]
MFKKILLLLCILLIAAGATLARADDTKDTSAAQILEQVPCEHWAYKEVKELGKKYSAEKKLPEGKTCPKSELCQCVLSILDKVMEKQEKEGGEAIPREDLDRIAALHEALKPELVKYEDYVLRRETIERILAKPEAAFEYKVGVNGFLRAAGVNNFKQRDLTYASGHSEGSFFYRVKPYAYWHPTDYLNIHLEGQGYGFAGGGEHSGKYSLYQGFVEGKIPEKDWLALKGGRQEFLYGSAFILGTNSFFDGLSFDAARLRVKPLEPLTIDLLGGRYATPFSMGLRGNLSGGYATYALSEGNTAEAYALRDTGSASHHIGEYLDIWGLRGTAKLEPVSLEFEPVYESGRILDPVNGVNDNINAYGGHIDAAVDATLAGYHNKFFLSYALGSGNKDAANGTKFDREFRNADNDTSLVGDMHVIGDLSGVKVVGHHASGLRIYTLGWGIDITKKLNFTATGHYFLSDAVEDRFSRHLGLETDYNLTYTISDNFSVILAYDRFFTGQFFRDASGSGKDINYGYVMFQFNFEKTKPKISKL